MFLALYPIIHNPASTILSTISINYFVPIIAYVPAIPSMYLILIIYSIANLNVVSWGTREVAEKKSKKQMKLEEEEEKQKKLQQAQFKIFS